MINDKLTERTTFDGGGILGTIGARIIPWAGIRQSPEPMIFRVQYETELGREISTLAA